MSDTMKVYFQGLNACIGRRPDVQRYASFIRECGHALVTKPADADMLLIWACGFRKDFADTSFALIQNYAAEHGEQNVVVCGCLPAIDEQRLRDVFPGKYFKWAEDTAAMDALFSPEGKSFAQAPRILSEPQHTDDFKKFWEDDTQHDPSYYDQFAKIFISEGCRYRCAYCAERLAFPDYASFPQVDILAACRAELDSGRTNKLMLVGDSLGDYGRDTGGSLPELIDAVLALRPDVKVGLLNLNPADFHVYKDYLVAGFKKGELFDCLLPIQSASDRLLGKMNRTYTKAQVQGIAQTLNDMHFKEWTSHFIVGFPTETEDDHQQTLDFLSSYRPKYVMASTYMESPQMPSAAIGDKVPAELARQRMMRLVALCRELGIICNYDGCEYAQRRSARRNTHNAA